MIPLRNVEAQRRHRRLGTGDPGVGIEDRIGGSHGTAGKCQSPTPTTPGALWRATMEEDMEDLDRMEEYEDLDPEDREMLEHMHLNFQRGPGMPRRWEDLSENAKEAIRDLYRKATRGPIEDA